jgi:A/G-specific adenine glycosylase
MRDQAVHLMDGLLAWYDRHRRHLPWRAEPGVTPDPYHVLVSELMLQQTTVATVKGRFDPFIQRFPTLEALAAADEGDVMHAWQGLGYYRRARALHAAAKAVVTDHDGCLPDTVDDLLALPGIGDYTAKAVAAIAFGRPVVPVDGNVVRVLARIFAVDVPMPKATRDVKDLAMAFEPSREPQDFAQALMDLGATVCRPKQPRCEICPWQESCSGLEKGIAETLPKRAPKAKRPLRQAVAFLLSRPDGAILFRKRPPKGLLGGLHELPSSPWLPAPVDREAALDDAPARSTWRFREGPVRHVFTHFTLDLDLAEAVTDDPPDGIWQSPDRLDELALPTVMKKVLRHAGKM